MRLNQTWRILVSDSPIFKKVQECVQFTLQFNEQKYFAIEFAIFRFVYIISRHLAKTVLNPWYICTKFSPSFIKSEVDNEGSAGFPFNAIQEKKPIFLNRVIVTRLSPNLDKISWDKLSTLLFRRLMIH